MSAPVEAQKPRERKIRILFERRKSICGECLPLRKHASHELILGTSRIGVACTAHAQRWLTEDPKP